MWEWERNSLHRTIGGRLGPKLRYYGILLFPSLFVCLLQPTHTHLHTHTSLHGTKGYDCLGLLGGLQSPNIAQKVER